jgi:hypothetical protein
MYRHAKIVPTVRPTTTTRPTAEPTYARYWRFTPPLPIDDPWPSDGFARPHVTDPWPTTAPVGADPSDTHVIDSETDFVDLMAALGDRGWSRARGVCWIYSPALQHVQLWLGHNDAMAVWVNGRCVHRGRYAAIAKYLDSRQVDMVPSAASLERGWNRVEVVVESWPSPYNTGWGFSMRLTTFDGRPVPGLRFSVTQPAAGLAPDYAAPEPGYRYRWESVEPAFHELLPNLSASDLSRLTGLRGLEIRGGVEGADGMVAIHVPRREEGPAYRAVPRDWDPARDADTRGPLRTGRPDAGPAHPQARGVRGLPHAPQGTARGPAGFRSDRPCRPGPGIRDRPGHARLRADAAGGRRAAEQRKGALADRRGRPPRPRSDVIGTVVICRFVASPQRPL